MSYGIPIVWSAREKPIVDAAVRTLLRGEYVTARSAARALHEQLSQLRRQTPEAQSPQAPKTLTGVYCYIRNRTRGKRLHGSQTFWKEREDRVLRRFVRSLLRGRYQSARDAAQACTQAFGKERIRETDRQWAAVPRSLRAIELRVWMKARAAGLARYRYPLAPGEQVVYDRYARALAEGGYRDLTPAARDCLKELDRLRRQCPGAGCRPRRSLSSVKVQLSNRAHRLGWSWNSSRWSPEERRILRRFVRVLSARGHPSTQRAASECFAALKRHYGRLTQTRSGRRTAGKLWTFMTIYTYLARQSKALGREVETLWSPEEDGIRRRQALGVVEGRFADAPAAARACAYELAGLRGRCRAGARTMSAVERRITELADALHRPWPGSRWTDAEVNALRRWTNWYEAMRMTTNGLRLTANRWQEE